MNAANWLMSEPVEKWARHAFEPSLKADHVSNNMSECFNSWIREDRDKPILQLLENFRRKIMIHFSDKWAEAEKLNDTITPYARENLTMNDKEARKLQVLHGRGCWYETLDQAGVKILVNTEDGTCDYGMWQMTGLPCIHAIAVFMYNREYTHDHVHWYYSNEAWKMAYDGNINPIPYESRWPAFEHQNIEPPVKKTKVGIPKKKRTRAPDEPRAPNAIFSKQCSLCAKLGHNRVTYPSKYMYINIIVLFNTFQKSYRVTTHVGCTSTADQQSSAATRANNNERSTSKATITQVPDVCSQIDQPRAFPGKVGKVMICGILSLYSKERSWELFPPLISGGRVVVLACSSWDNCLPPVTHFSVDC
ncbi:hypothetical protein EZV62_027210 [Acer yangbiense]|uniref:Zinc finger PMZ-type domain-containing protein n=1 Tax=Acer yangbiense TaxID=1000413 RepID=A0A5C7GUY8_9ROSI|nr:hypothetical protein EZV62_027210 [Acer yangbiense]